MVKSVVEYLYFTDTCLSNKQSSLSPNSLLEVKKIVSKLFMQTCQKKKSSVFKLCQIIKLGLIALYISLHRLWAIREANIGALAGPITSWLHVLFIWETKKKGLKKERLQGTFKLLKSLHANFVPLFCLVAWFVILTNLKELFVFGKQMQKQTFFLSK